MVQTTVKQMSAQRVNPPVVINPVPGRPGNYANKYGMPCNAVGGPLDCSFGNPNCLGLLQGVVMLAMGCKK